MSNQATTRVTAVQTVAVTPSPTRVPQRICACGYHTAAGECDTCQKERENPFQRAAVIVPPKELASPSGVARIAAPQSRRDVDARYDLAKVRATVGQPLSSTRWIQRKLAVNTPGDAYEQEADRIALRVMRMPDPSAPVLHRVEPEAQRICKRCEKERVQRQESQVWPSGSSAISPSMLTTGGVPLPQSVRSFYEPRFGYELGSVRVHAGASADRMTENLQARAFTYANHIWLGSGERPQQSFCLAHELVHVIQQTQPKRAYDSRIRAGSLTDSDPHGIGAPGMVQRLGDVYWVAQEYYARKGNTGKEIQDDIYASRSGAKDVSEEVNVPNAARKKNSEDSESGLHVQSGVADLYRADKQLQIGVYFDENHTPHRLAVKKGLTARPVVERGVLIGTDKGPKWVRIGEIKPATAGMIRSGKRQVTNYLEGIKLAGEETNTWAAAQKDVKPWPLDPNSVVEMSASDFTPHRDHTPRSTTGTLYDLILVEWTVEDRKPKVVLFPQQALGERVEGRMHVNSFGGGVWAYHFEPTNLADLLSDPARRGRLTRKQARAIDFAQALQNSVIDPITGAPVQGMTLRAPNARRSDVAVRQTAAPHLQRAGKEPPRVRDTFPLEQVVAARGQLRTRFTKEKETEPFQALRGIGLLYQAEAALGSAGVTVREKLPDEKQLSLTLKTQTGGKTVGVKGGSKTAGETTQAISKAFQWFEVWTHPAIDTLARIRKIFGTTFVTIGTKIRALKERIGNKLRETFDKHAGSDARGTSYGAVALRAIARALKAIGSIIIPQTLRLIVQSLIDGVKAKIREVIPLDVESLARAVANDFAEFKVIQEKIASLNEIVEAEITSVIDGLAEKLKGIKDVISLASEVAGTVKWTVRAIQCGTPPGWGCLKLAFSSLTAYIAEKVLSSCSLQREVACLTSGLDFVRTGIPKVIASAITDAFNTLVGRIHPKLAPLFAEIKDVPLLSCNEIGCEGGRSEMDLAFDRLQTELERKHGTLGAAWLMDSLFDMSRLAGAEEGDMLTADEVRELTDLLLKHNVTPAELQLLVEQQRQQVKEGKPLQKVTPQELMDEIERQRQVRGEVPTPEGEPRATAPTGDSGGTGGTEGTGGGGGPAGGTENAEGPGLATVDAARAKFDGKIRSTLDRTRVVVESPDPAVHKAGAEDVKVALIGLIDGKPIKRVADVPVTIKRHVRRKGKVTIPYVLQQGECFTHAVEGVPTFCVEKGTVLKMPLEKAPRKRSKRP